MARYTFAGTSGDQATAAGDVMTVRGSLAQVRPVYAVPGQVAQVYAASTGGSPLTDLLDAAGNPITVVTADQTGQFPEFSGPDGVSIVWLDPADSSATRFRLHAKIDVAAAVDTAVAAIPPSTLTVGTVDRGDTPSAALVPTGPRSQQLNLVLPKGDTGGQGVQGLPGVSPALSQARQLGAQQIRAAGTSFINRGLSGLGGTGDYTPAAGDVVLLKDQTDATQNGVWVAAAGAWSRHPSFPAGSDLAGLMVYVTNGSRYANTVWHAVGDSPVQAGATAVTFQQTGRMLPSATSATLRRPQNSDDGRVTIAGVGWVQRTSVFCAVDYGLNMGYQAGTIDSAIPIQRAIDACAAAGGGVVVIPAGTYFCQSRITLPNSIALAGAAGAVDLVGDNAGTTTLRWTTDLGAGNFALDYASGSASNQSYSKVRNITLQGATSSTVPFAMYGIRCLSKSQYEDVQTRGFAAGNVPWGDHIKWTRCSGSASTYNVLYMAGANTAGDHIYMDCNWAGAIKASVGIRPTLSGDSSGTNKYSIAGARFIGGHMGFADYCIYIEAPPVPPDYTATAYTTLRYDLIRGTTFFNPTWEAANKAYIYEEPDVNGIRRGTISDTQFLGCNSWNGPNAPGQNVMVAIGGIKDMTFDFLPSDVGVSTTTHSGFLATVIEGLMFRTSLATPMVTWDERATPWNVIDAAAVGVEVTGVNYRQLFCNLSGAPSAGRFVSHIPDLTLAAGAFPLNSTRPAQYGYRRASPMSAGRPIFGFLRRVDAGAQPTGWVVKRGYGGAATKATTTQVIAAGDLLYATATGAVSNVPVDGTYVGWALTASNGSTATVTIYVDM